MSRHPYTRRVSPATEWPRPSSWWRRSVDSRQIWIDQNTGRSIGDFPARRPQVFQSDWVVFFRVRLVLSGLSYEDSHREYTARESRLHHWHAPPGRPCRGVYFEQSKPVNQPNRGGHGQNNGFEDLRMDCRQFGS